MSDRLTELRERRHERDMADAHETARARDARASTITVTFHADTSGFDRAIKRMTEQMAATAPTRREAIRRALAPLAEARPLTDFHREWLYVMDTQHPHTPQETDMPNNQRRHREQMGVLDQIHDTLTEIRDRLPEREAACGDVWRDETERPCTRPSGHDGNHVDKVGTIWANPEPAPADVDPDEDDEPDPLAEVIHLAVSEELGWEHVAYAAREHIEAERIDAEAKRDQWKADVRDAAIARADKAEADLARVTKERDEAVKRVAVLDGIDFMITDDLSQGRQCVIRKNGVVISRSLLDEDAIMRAES